MPERRYPPLEAGVMDAGVVRAIAIQMVKACEDAGFPFGLDLEGAKRLLALHDIDLDAEEGADLELWSEETGATTTRQPYAGTKLMIGGGPELADLQAVACCLVLAAEATPKFPFGDPKHARKLLAYMGGNVDVTGDVDLQRLADRKGAPQLTGVPAAGV